MSNEFDPRSSDAMFARLLAQGDEQGKTLARIESALRPIEQRVEQLERDKWYQRGIVAAVGTGAAIVASKALAFWEWAVRR